MAHVLVVGGGCREHVLAATLASSHHVDRVSVAPSVATRTDTNIKSLGK